MSRSGDRHLRPDPEGRLSGIRPGLKRVIVRAEVEYSAKPATQHLLQMLINLLARQYGVVDEIIIDVAPVAAFDGAFLLHAVPGTLPQKLLNLGRIVAGPEIEVRLATTPMDRSPGDANIEVFSILVGPFDPRIHSNPAVAIIADGWRFECASDRPVYSSQGASANPAGPYLAACFAAAAAFKYFRYLDHSIDLGYSLWDWVTDTWSDLSPGQEPTGIVLPVIYMIGGGAVGTACAFTLAATPQLCARMPIVDPQDTDETSRNRLLSARYEDEGQPKVNLIKQLFSRTAVQIFPYKGLWPDYTVDYDRETPPDIRAHERTDHFEWVLSCVDRNIHRRNIAIYLPRHVIGGSTAGLGAQVSYYSMSGTCPCLGCYHPVPAIRPTEELRDDLLAMSFAERQEWYARHDADARTIAALEEYLNDPECGGPGAAELARLGREGETDWAAGFVSVAAGVMQASMLLQLMMRGVRPIIESGTELYAWFASPDVARSIALRRADCDICGDAARQERSRRLWTAL